MTRQLLRLGEDEWFQQRPNILAKCTATPTLPGRMASFNFFWFLFHNIGISPLEIGIGTALLGDGELELDM